MHTFMHVAGVICIVYMGVAGVYTIWTTIEPRRAQIAVAIAPLLPSYTNAYRNRVDGRRRKVAALIALVLFCAASLYRGGFA